MSILARLQSLGSGIRWIRQSRPENCVQTVLAMALGVPTEWIEEIAGTAGALTIRETMDLLNRFGIESRPMSADLVADFWPSFYRLNGGRKLRGLGFRLPRDGERVGHAYFLIGRRMYDPASGRLQRLDEETLRRLDLLAIFPEDLHRTVAKHFRSNGI